MSIAKNILLGILFMLMLSKAFALENPPTYRETCWQNGDAKKTSYLNNGRGIALNGTHGSCGCAISMPKKYSIAWEISISPIKTPARSVSFSRMIRVPDDFSPYTEYFSDATKSELTSIILSTSSESGGCPSQDGYDRIFQLVQKEWAQQAVEEEKRKRELQLEKEQKLNYLRRVCKGSPRIAINVLEFIANNQNVHPKSITLERVGLDTSFSPKCIGTFYSSKGSQSREIFFDDSGMINNIGPSE